MQEALPPPGAADGLLDIIQPLEVPGPGYYLLLLGLLAGAGILLAILIHWLVQRSRRASFPELPGSPRRLAIRRMEALRLGVDAMTCGESSRQAAGILREFLHREFGALASFATGPELSGHRRGDGPPPHPAVVPFAECITAFEGLRFGRAEAPAFEAQGVIDQALRLLEGGGIKPGDAVQKEI